MKFSTALQRDEAVTVTAIKRYAQQRAEVSLKSTETKGPQVRTNQTRSGHGDQRRLPCGKHHPAVRSINAKFSRRRSAVFLLTCRHCRPIKPRPYGKPHSPKRRRWRMGSCEKVQGEISRVFWCRLFAKAQK